MITDNGATHAAEATSALRQNIENAEQNLLGNEKHAQLEKTEQAAHDMLGPSTDRYLLVGVLVVIILIATGIYRFMKRKKQENLIK